MMYPFLEALRLDEGTSGAAAGAFLPLDTRAAATYNPATAAPIAVVRQADAAATEQVVAAAAAAWPRWRNVSTPHRGEFVRLLGEGLRQQHEALGKLVAVEIGLPLGEAMREVQRAIDAADFALGLSRQLRGASPPAEHPGQRLVESWRPLGPTLILTDFASPVAAWARHATIAWVAGNPVVWRASPHSALCALALQRLAVDALTAAGLPRAASGMLVGPPDVTAEPLVGDARLPLVVFHGDRELGGQLRAAVAQRGARSVVEGGGSNAAVVLADADLDQAVAGCVRGGFRWAGQSRTALRRVIVEAPVVDAFLERLLARCGALELGDPLQPDTETGPVVSQATAFDALDAVKAARGQGGEILIGGGRAKVSKYGGFFIQPTVIRATPEVAVMERELRGPILFVMPAATRDAAFELAQATPRAPLHAVFTRDGGAAERFLTASDADITTVNTVEYGALALPSDAWKPYTRRQICTIDHGAAGRPGAPRT